MSTTTDPRSVEGVFHATEKHWVGNPAGLLDVEIGRFGPVPE
jgi:hypothetical protein